MNVQMPGLDGIEATRLIRQREGSGSHIPIVAMTAHVLPEDRALCFAAGMDGYVSKPFKPWTFIVRSKTQWLTAAS
jgi:CheY-like chemotaxis protein